MEFIWEHLWGILATLMSAGLGLLSMKYSSKYKDVKGFLEYLIQAIEDGKVTEDEVKELASRGKKVFGLD